MRYAYGIVEQKSVASSRKKNVMRFHFNEKRLHTVHDIASHFTQKLLFADGIEKNVVA